LVDVVNDLFCSVDNLGSSRVGDCDVQEVSGVLAGLILEFLERVLEAFGEEICSA
jgi:hypothetical protein